MKTIKVERFPPYSSPMKGDVYHLFIHGLKYAPELRGPNSPRIRLLEDRRHPHTECELIDEWPDAPEYWPPESAPKPAPSTAANQGRKSA